MGSQPLVGAATAAVRAPGALAPGTPSSTSSTPTERPGCGSTRTSVRSRAAVVPQSVASPRVVDRHCSQAVAQIPGTGIEPLPQSQ